jgi:hypothetical protein
LPKVKDRSLTLLPLASDSLALDRKSTAIFQDIAIEIAARISRKRDFDWVRLFFLRNAMQAFTKFVKIAGVNMFISVGYA